MELVGLQVWRGALFLADFIISHDNLFKDKIILELGSGSGFVGIIAARTCNLCFLTDYESSILSNCYHNVELNYHLFPTHSPDSLPARVRKLDLLSPLEPFPACLLLTEKGCPYQWTSEDIKNLSAVDKIIASDIIYNEVLTDAFFRFLEKTWSLSPGIIAYVSLEKRIQFSEDFLEDISPAYDYFINKLQNSNRKFKRISGNFSQTLDYERVEELQLWEISF